MNIQNIEKFLQDNPGYLKWGDVRIANKLNVDLEIVSVAKNNVKSGTLSKTTPRILLLDIETSPLLAYTWGMWKQNINLDGIVSDWFMISWAGKWLDQNNAFGDILEPTEVILEDDFRITKSLWKALEIADIVITHNGDKFDIKKINARFIENGMGPVTPYKSIDTLKVARKNFGFTSNKLEALARKFGFEGKHTTGFKLWTDCLKGEPTALLKMFNYNIQDILILEKLYYKLRPWMKSHPNLGLYTIDDEVKCPNCGGVNLLEAGYNTTAISKYQTYRCSECGTISRDRSTMLTREENKKIITQVK